jgi:hypothetical protein
MKLSQNPKQSIANQSKEKKLQMEMTSLKRQIEENSKRKAYKNSYENKNFTIIIKEDDIENDKFK